MRKAIVLFLLVLSFAPVSRAADAPLGVEQFTSLEELALKLSSYFPKVQGEVTGVQGDRVTLSLGKKDGLIPGMVLTLWRPGKEILHPVTKSVIGHVEDMIGTVEVTSAAETTSSGLVKKKLKDAQQGDRARITPKKINAAVLPIREENPEIINGLVQRLNEFGRLNVLESSKVEAFVRNTKAKDAELVRELGSAFGLDAVIAVGLYPSDSKLMVTARIFYTEDASQLDTIVAMLDLKAKAQQQVISEVKPFFTPKQEEKSESPELPFVAQNFTMGDFEGNAKIEYAFSDGARVHVYRNEPSGWMEAWTEVAADKTGNSTLEWQGQTAAVRHEAAPRLINIDSADINGNGRPEIFVTAMKNGKVSSSVIEFQDGKYKSIAEVPGFLRVIRYPGEGTILIGQAYDPATFYSGQPRKYAWSNGSYAPGDELNMPKGLGLYGWTFASVGERQPLLVALDDDDHLLAYLGDTLLWKSAEQYPVVDNYVYKPLTGLASGIQKQSENDKGQKVRIRGRVQAADVNGDGRDEILIPKNTSSMFMGGFTGAELYALSWTGVRLDPVWSAKEIRGPIYDLDVVQGQSAAKINALVRTKGGLFTKDRQQMMIYTVK